MRTQALDINGSVLGEVMEAPPCTIIVSKGGFLKMFDVFFNNKMKCRGVEVPDEYIQWVEVGQELEIQ